MKKYKNPAIEVSKEVTFLEDMKDEEIAKCLEEIGQKVMQIYNTTINLHNFLLHFFIK